MVKANPHAVCPERAAPQDVIVDTDIGTDIDDAYAVLLAVSSPELNVRGITLVHGNLRVRANIVLKLLKLAGRPDIPVLPGESMPMNSDRPIHWVGHEGRGLDFSDVETELERSFEGPSAPEFLAQMAAETPGQLVLLPIGPLTNVGLAIERYPREMAKLKCIVAMASTFNGFGRQHAGVEHNIALDPEAAEIVLASGIPVLLIGLNVTRQTALTRRAVEEISAAGTPLADFMARMTEDWLAMTDRSQTPMHDPLAVASCIEPSIEKSVQVSAEVDLETPGLVAYAEAGSDSPLRICTELDAGRFDRLFQNRIMSAVGVKVGCR
jgi:purine nucleosidase